MPNPTRACRLLKLAAWVLILAACGVFFQHTAGLLFSRTVSIRTDKIQPAEGGVAFSASGGNLARELQRLHPQAVVTEDGVRLPVRVRVSEEVRTGRAGRFSFTGKNVWFSATDGSDPRENGRTYAVVFPVRVPYALVGVAWLALATGLVCAIRAWSGTWVWSWWRTQSQSPFQEAPRDWSLDVLRALAVILVLFRHALVCPDTASAVLHEVTTLLQRGGWIGVDLFFVISGYLVSGLLFREHLKTQRLRVGRFLWRRAMKIYPAFWVMLIVTLIGASFGLVPGLSINGVIGEALFLQNYVGNIWMHTWTLAVEEHFYILLAFMFALAVENGREQSGKLFSFVPRVFLSFAVACLAIRCLRHLYMGPSAAAHFPMTHVRLDALMCGVWLRHWHEEHPMKFSQLSLRGTWRFMGLALLLPIPFFVFDLFEWQWITSVGFTVAYAAAALLLFASRSWDERWPRLKGWSGPWATIGRHSYSIYLWHVIIESWIARPLLENVWSPVSLGGWLCYAVVYLGGSIAGGILMGKMIEQPVLHLRDRLFPSQHKAVDATRLTPEPAS